jgi:hypothetical protein
LRVVAAAAVVLTVEAVVQVVTELLRELLVAVQVLSLLYPFCSPLITLSQSEQVATVGLVV